MWTLISLPFWFDVLVLMPFFQSLHLYSLSISIYFYLEIFTYETWNFRVKRNLKILCQKE